MEETAGALASAVAQGKALYVGVSSYSSDWTRRTADAGINLWKLSSDQ
jgi:L-glyceraldehyde 3-phosphate reductase